SALAHAHAAHIAHGDLKPENVLLTDGHTLVADTGIVGAVERSLPRGTPGAVTGALCATTYVAPERRAPGGKNGAAAATPADDMFAVGVLVHEMLTGRPPTPESEPLEEVRSVPPWLAELERRCLAPDPASRWPDGTASTSTERFSTDTNQKARLISATHSAYTTTTAAARVKPNAASCTTDGTRPRRYSAYPASVSPSTTSLNRHTSSRRNETNPCASTGFASTRSRPPLFTSPASRPMPGRSTASMTPVSVLNTPSRTTTSQ